MYCEAMMTIFVHISYLTSQPKLYTCFIYLIFSVVMSNDITELYNNLATL